LKNEPGLPWGRSDRAREEQFRAAMVRAGFDSAELSLDAAFERGMKYAGLA
jgi:hypothetical protein